MTTSAPSRRPGRRSEFAVELPTRIRLADGRIYDGPLAAERHRRIHVGLIHSHSAGYVEIAAGARPAGGKVKIATRRDPRHFLPGGGAARGDWIAPILALVARHAAAGEEVFVAPAVRAQPAAAKQHVAHTNWLWVDVDGPDSLPALWAFLAARPAHLVIESAGSGGVHVYWMLKAPLNATPTDHDGAGVTSSLRCRRSPDPIEAAHERLVFALGYEWVDGVPRPTVADPACRDRSRVMRVAGSVNNKSGRHARILWADLALAAWDLDSLIGSLPDPPQSKVPPAARPIVNGGGEDPYKRIAPAAYFERLAGIRVPRNGLVSCPNPAHRDRTPSCHVGRDASEGWLCHGCQAGGAIYDLASVLDGGPTRAWLRGEDFKRARDRVRLAFGDWPARGTTSTARRNER